MKIQASTQRQIAQIEDEVDEIMSFFPGMCVLIKERKKSSQNVTDEIEKDQGREMQASDAGDAVDLHRANEAKKTRHHDEHFSNTFEYYSNFRSKMACPHCIR